jgi:LmbE family N-acetylglucosaminyl deacetylase
MSSILVFAPHPDDEVLGCGGVIARHAEGGDDVFVCIVTKGMPPVYCHPPEVQHLPHSLINEIDQAHRILGVKKTLYLELPAVMMESVPRHELNHKISDTIAACAPDFVYMPHYGDMQKDHEITAEAIMVAVRPKAGCCVRFVYAYETLSETEWNMPNVKNAFLPNTYVNIDNYLDKKLAAMRCYPSQLSDFPNPRSIEAVEALAKYRGATMNCRSAEAFMLIREYRI